MKTCRRYSAEFLIFGDGDHCQPLLGLLASEQKSFMKIQSKIFFTVLRHFGLNSADEIFQKKIMDQFQDMEGVIIIVNELVAFGKTQAKHDRCLHSLLETCHKVGVKYNSEKLEVGQDAITFMGYHITKEGIVMDPNPSYGRAKPLEMSPCWNY